MFPFVARPLEVIAITGRASCPDQEGCSPTRQSAETTLRKTKSLDIGSPPFVSLNTNPRWEIRGRVSRMGPGTPGRQRTWFDRPVCNPAIYTTWLWPFGGWLPATGGARVGSARRWRLATAFFLALALGSLGSGVHGSQDAPGIVGSSLLLAQARRTCKQVSSCEEAVRLWCGGYRRADGDKDGIPCENVCRSKQEVDAIRRKIGC